MASPHDTSSDPLVPPSQLERGVEPPQGTPEERLGSSTNDVPSGIVRSLAAFRRDLQGLLKKHPGQWVAYNCEERVGFSSSKIELYQKCLSRGLSQSDFVVRRVVPDVPRVVEERPL